MNFWTSLRASRLNILNKFISQNEAEINTFQIKLDSLSKLDPNGETVYALKKMKVSEAISHISWAIQHLKDEIKSFEFERDERLPGLAKETEGLYLQQFESNFAPVMKVLAKTGKIYTNGVDDTKEGGDYSSVPSVIADIASCFN
jgi:SPX domain protein involved in polyphosphate accumulation